MSTASTDTTIPADAPKPRRMPDPWTFTLPVAAHVSGLSVATLRRRAAEGKLTLRHVGSRTLVCADSLRALLTGEAA